MSKHASVVAALFLAACLQAQPLTGQAIDGRAVSGETSGPLASLGDPEQVAGREPAEGRVDVWRDTDLSWAPTESTHKHDVYFGAVFDDVNEAGRARPLGVLVRRDQQADTYDPGRLEFGRTYYWRVDEVRGAPDYTIVKGKAWAFTTETLAYQIEKVTAQASSSQAGAGPEHTIDGSGLDADEAHSIDQAAMWLSRNGAAQPTWLRYDFDGIYKLHEMQIWNYNAASESISGFGLKDVTIEYASNGVDWVALGDFEFAQASATRGYAYNTAVDFGGVTVRQVRIRVHSNWGGRSQYGLSEVRFFRIPMRARQPEPASEAVGVSVDSTLRWQPGREAAWHELYISTDIDAVTGRAALVDVLAEGRFPLASLDLGQRYYWRVDEVNESERPQSWAGNLWSFTTQEYMALDDFESYDDDDNCIYETWIDGYDIPANGSQVGHLDVPFAEQMIVHSGAQSMPLFYDNGGDATRSEAEITWSAPRNWIARGAEVLVLHIRGAMGNDPVPLYIVIEDNAARFVVLKHPDSNVALRTDWQTWRIAFSELGAVSMHMTSIAKLVIGLGDRDNPTPGGSGVIYIDDILIGRPAPGP